MVGRRFVSFWEAYFGVFSGAKWLLVLGSVIGVEMGDLGMGWGEKSGVSFFSFRQIKRFPIMAGCCKDVGEASRFIVAGLWSVSCSQWEVHRPKAVEACLKNLMFFAFFSPSGILKRVS